MKTLTFFEIIELVLPQAGNKGYISIYYFNMYLSRLICLGHILGVDNTTEKQLCCLCLVFPIKV